MLRLNLPSFPFKIKQTNGKISILDEIRRRFIALTPEEWVRQHFVSYLINYKNFPKALISNEISIKLNHTSKRCDTVIYNRNLIPMVIVEYKSPEVEINQKVFDQISRYNIVFRVPYLMVSNGIVHYCCRVDYEQQIVHFLKEIPDYHTVIQK